MPRIKKLIILRPKLFPFLFFIYRMLHVIHQHMAQNRLSPFEGWQQFLAQERLWRAEAKLEEEKRRKMAAFLEAAATAAAEEPLREEKERREQEKRELEVRERLKAREEEEEEDVAPRVRFFLFQQFRENMMLLVIKL